MSPPSAADVGGASCHRYVTRGRPRRGGAGAGAGAGAGGTRGAAVADEKALATIAAGLHPAQLSKPERQLFAGAKMRLYLQAR